MHRRIKPDGRYGKTVEVDELLIDYLINTPECGLTADEVEAAIEVLSPISAEPDDEWNEITAAESPNALEFEPKSRNKRSGEYLTHAFAEALKECDAEKTG